MASATGVNPLASHFYEAKLREKWSEATCWYTDEEKEGLSVDPDIGKLWANHQ